MKKLQRSCNCNDIHGIIIGHRRQIGVQLYGKTRGDEEELYSAALHQDRNFTLLHFYTQDVAFDSAGHISGPDKTDKQDRRSHLVNVISGDTTGGGLQKDCVY